VNQYQAAQIKQRFNRAAQTYNDKAVICQEVGDRLLERLAFLKIKPERIVDLGCGTGYCTTKLEKIYPGAQLIAVDFADKLLAQVSPAYQKHLAHASVLPFPDGGMDFILSNLMLPWCDDVGLIIQEVNRVLKPGGLFCFSTFGPDTAKEIKETWARIDDAPHVHPCLDMHDVGDRLSQASFTDVVMEVEHLVFTYSDSIALVKELKAIGFTNVLANRQRGLLGKNKWDTFLKIYPLNEKGRAPLSLEVVYGHAWKSEPKKPEGPDESTVSLEQLYRNIRQQIKK